MKSVSQYLTYFFDTRKNKFNDIVDYIIFIGNKYHWFEKTETGYKKGENYKVFVFFIEQCEDKEEVVFGKIKLLDTMLLALCISIWATPTSILFRSIICIFSLLLKLYMGKNIQFLYKVQDQLDEYLKIKKEIDNSN